MERVFWDLISQLENNQSLTPRQFAVIIPFLQKEEQFIFSSDDFIRTYFKILISSEYLVDISDLLVEPKYNGTTSFM